MYTHVSKCKNDKILKRECSKQLDELKENSNKRLNEMRKTIWDTNEEFNKDTEILKKSNFNPASEKLNNPNK
jgi:hypothetical protein